MLTADAIEQVRRKMLMEYTVKPDSVVIHSSWFLHKDGTPMDMGRRFKRYAAIKRLVRIRLARRVEDD